MHTYIFTIIGRIHKFTLFFTTATKQTSAYERQQDPRPTAKTNQLSTIWVSGHCILLIISINTHTHIYKYWTLLLLITLLPNWIVPTYVNTVDCHAKLIYQAHFKRQKQDIVHYFVFGKYRNYFVQNIKWT